ncbi:hypothetical protein [Sphingomonas sp. KC8]|uniref:hypothetical protein n=1 Tax=Sphingomonas sp. KC8 TaxID=1030157 RepID=UPI000248BB96|nr:hypothetical protein [Sphingomonas sp. KC8]ARS28493.1 hypothetical protein KC8_14525 [Sphingomonas sp. KC8]
MRNSEAYKNRQRRDALRVARALMVDALDRLDAHSRSPAAATLDLALHHLDRELKAPVPMS